MIDESVFCTRFVALWNVLTPSMEHFVRSTNLDLYERYQAPIGANTEPEVRAILSEAAFLAVNQSLQTSRSVRKYARSEAENLIEAGYGRVANLRGNVGVRKPISKATRDELGELAHAIWRYFDLYQSTNMVTPEPKFKGCGYLSPCSGDYACSNSYIEMKNVDRNFGAADFRQIITYLFLDWAAGQVRYNGWVLLNARKGIFVSGSVEDLVHGCAGKSADVLFEEMMYNVTSGDLSR